MKVALAVAALATGCGSGLWLLTPRPEVTYQEVTRTTAVQVTTTTPGATLFVDGAEAGQTPRTIAVTHKELRRQRRQSIWLPLLGSAIDAIAFTIATVGAADAGSGEAVIAFGATGMGTLLLDLYLITGRSVVNEGVDQIPAATEIGVRAANFHDSARRIRVPDITRVHFDLVPLGMPDSAPAAPPAAPAAPAPAPASGTH